jgi:hypothetical protein
LLIQQLPSEFDKVAWIDADLLFLNADWREDAARLLELYPVVQLFERAVLLDDQRQPTRAFRGIAAEVARRPPGMARLGGGHPGFAWAARRNLLERHGLLDNNILGGADTGMVAGMYGWWHFWYLDTFSAALRHKVQQWMWAFYNDVQGEVGNVPGTVLHLWHGDRSNRQYVDRLRWLSEHQFDPDADLRRSPQGLWEWSGEKPDLERTVRDYFAARREDD